MATRDEILNELYSDLPAPVVEFDTKFADVDATTPTVVAIVLANDGPFFGDPSYRFLFTLPPPCPIPLCFFFFCYCAFEVLFFFLFIIPLLRFGSPYTVAGNAK